jgi:hypothetical protein
LARRADGTVVAWGGNGFGESTVPPRLIGVTQVVAGAWHSMALKADRTVVCWGRNEYGQRDVPSDLGPAVAISGDRGNTSVALLEDGSVRVWGRWNETYSATPPSAPQRWRAISSGGYHAIGVPDMPTCTGDVTSDGAIDGNDLAIILSNWGACP